MQRIAAGLQVAHERDHPSRRVADNIIVPGGDVARAKIIDFGIARSTMLNEGTVIGSGLPASTTTSRLSRSACSAATSPRNRHLQPGLVLVQASPAPIDMGGAGADRREAARCRTWARSTCACPLLTVLQPDPDQRLSRWPRSQSVRGPPARHGGRAARGSASGARAEPAPGDAGGALFGGAADRAGHGGRRLRLSRCLRPGSPGAAAPSCSRHQNHGADCRPLTLSRPPARPCVLAAHAADPAHTPA